MMMDDGLMMHLTVDFEIKMPRCCRCRSQVEGAGSSCGGGLEWPMPLDQVTRHLPEGVFQNYLHT
jgi:hypothetical protein